MISGFIVKKGHMTSVFTPEGKRLAVTQCVCAPLKVTQVKTTDKDGYKAVQVAYGSKKTLDQPTSAKLKKIKTDIKPQHFKEFELTAEIIPEISSDITVDAVLNIGDSIQAAGLTKGRGFAGVIKRHHFQRQPVSGGQSDRVRAPGAIGAQTPGKVVRGKKMPGHMGNKIKTITGLKIVSIDKDKQLISISGSIPGAFNSWLVLTKE